MAGPCRSLTLFVLAQVSLSQFSLLSLIILGNSINVSSLIGSTFCRETHVHPEVFDMYISSICNVYMYMYTATDYSYLVSNAKPTQKLQATYIIC